MHRDRPNAGQGAGAAEDLEGRGKGHSPQDPTDDTTGKSEWKTTGIGVEWPSDLAGFPDQDAPVWIVRSDGSPMTRILEQRWIFSTAVGALLAAAVAAPPHVLAGQQPSGAKKAEVVITKPTPAQAAAHRKALQARQATITAALVKARARQVEASQAFAEKQRAELKAENAKVMAEIIRLRGSGTSPTPPR